MATRSNIGARQQDGTIKAIYCHWDGYPEGVGAVLAEHYNDGAKVAKLLELGDISSLHSTIEDTKQASYASRGEVDFGARTYADDTDWAKNAENQDAEFIYLFEQGFDGSYEWNYFPIVRRWTSLRKSELIQS